jgi:hypothetical protein
MLGRMARDANILGLLPMPIKKDGERSKKSIEYVSKAMG